MFKFAILFLSSYFLHGLSAYGQGSKPLSGDYVVPAGDFLAEPVTIDLKRARFIEGRRNRVRLDYKLPKVIDGPNPSHFVLTGTLKKDGSPAVLRGPKVDAVCEQFSEVISCVMTYQRNEKDVFELDHDGADTYLSRQTNLSSDRKIALKDARLSLSHEALGIVKIYLGK